MHRDDSTTVVIVPVLGRPHRIRPLFESLEAGTPEPHHVAFAATAGDTEVLAEIYRLAELDAARCSLHLFAPAQFGDYARKINGVYRVTAEPFIFTAADDLAFRPGWLTVALEAMADPKIGVVGTQDLAPTERARAGAHSTHCLIRRSYADELGVIDRPGAIFCEEYWHEYVDDELVGTAKARGAWCFPRNPESIVEHLHPSWGKAEFDPMYRRQRRRMMAGARVYAERCHLWT